jgi:O-methyltransferase domain/Dimerisation domain
MTTTETTPRRGASPDPVQPTSAERAAAPALLRMIWGIHISRCVYAVAELGIADLLASGPMSSAELATATETDEPSLYRVLRALAGLRVFEEHDARCFTLTVIGERLCTGAPACMRSWAIFLEALGGVRPFGHILETIKTGRPGREIEFGTDLFEFIAQNPEAAALFDAAMSERTAAYAPSVAQAHDFSDIRTIVDVGGGEGTLLVEILRRHAHLSGVLVERLIPEDGADPVPTLLSDINMLVLTGGQERTNAEYSKLFEAAGLRLGNVQAAAFPYGVIEGLAA